MRRASLAGHGASPEAFLNDLSREQRRSVLFATLEQLNGDRPYSFLHRFFNSLLAQPIGLSVDGLGALMSMDSPHLDHAGFRGDLFKYIAIAAEQLQRDQAPGANDLVAHLVERVLDWNVQTHYGRESRFRQNVAGSGLGVGPLRRVPTT